jgi:hypothetical protein
LILVLVFRPYERASLRFVSLVSEHNVNLALFMFTILIIPLVLVLI